MNHLGPRPRQRDPIAGADPPSEAWGQDAACSQSARSIRARRTAIIGELKTSWFRAAALIFFAFLLATNFYRAATQSIVHDEALTWQFYLSGPASAIFQTYDANNHFLATVLFRISTALFGQSEFAMRLPTVLAGAWFFWTVLRLNALLFGEGWFFLLGCAALTLNPILLDFLVAARGYGLAMAGLFWGLYEMLAWIEERRQGMDSGVLHKRLWKAAAGCSIAVAANLILLMPVFTIAAAFCVLLLRTRETSSATKPAPANPRKKTKKGKPEPAALAPTRSYRSLLHFVIPVALLALVFLLASPIDSARTGLFYSGAPTADVSVRSVMEVSFGYGDRTGLPQRIEEIWMMIGVVFLPGMVMAGLATTWIVRRSSESVVVIATLFSSLAVAVSAFLLFCAHSISGIPYPEDRTGIYFVPLATLAALGLARILMERAGPPRWIGIAASVVLASFAIEFAAQFNVKSFWVWRYDADTKRIFAVLEAAPKPAAAPDGQVRLGVSWVYEPALNYYREVRNATWMAPVLRDGFSGARQFFVVSPQDQGTPAVPKMKQIYKGPVSGTVVGVPETGR